MIHLHPGDQRVQNCLKCNLRYPKLHFNYRVLFSALINYHHNKETGSLCVCSVQMDLANRQTVSQRFITIFVEGLIYWTL